MKEIARYCGPVPCGTIKKPFKDRLMVIGDAAGMANLPQEEELVQDSGKLRLLSKN